MDGVDGTNVEGTEVEVEAEVAATEALVAMFIMFQERAKFRFWPKQRRGTETTASVRIRRAATHHSQSDSSPVVTGALRQIDDVCVTGRCSVQRAACSRASITGDYPKSLWRIMMS